MISRCSRPRKPQRKPKPSAAEVSGSKSKLASLRRSFASAVAQMLEIGGVGREQAAEHDRLHRLEAGQRRRGGAALLGDGVADAAVGHGLDAGGDEADLAGAELVDLHRFRREDADALDLVRRRPSP